MSLATAFLFGARPADQGDVRCCGRRLLMAAATDDWRTFGVLACSRGEPTALSDDAVAKCREASRLMTEWKQMPR